MFLPSFPPVPSFLPSCSFLPSFLAGLSFSRQNPKKTKHREKKTKKNKPPYYINNITCGSENGGFSRCGHVNRKKDERDPSPVWKGKNGVPSKKKRFHQD
jgi:hypothetical protein